MCERCKELEKEIESLKSSIGEYQQIIADMDKAYRKKLENIWCYLDGTWLDIQKIKDMCMNPYDEKV